MISMLILAIAFLALIAVQVSALQGYISARDNTEATELGRRTADLLRTQGLQWWDNAYSGAPMYSGTDTPFDTNDAVGGVLGAGGGWYPLVLEPVDSRFNRKAFDAAHMGGKFCIYARGARIGGALNDAALQFQIAVVYPGPNAILTDCEDQVTDDQLDDVGEPGVAPVLESAGLRANYFGALVVRRSHLTLGTAPAGGP